MSRNIYAEEMKRGNGRETDGDEEESWGSGGEERQTEKMRSKI